MNTKKKVFLFKIVSFLGMFFLFIEFEYYMKLFVWMMNTSWLECVLVVSLVLSLTSRAAWPSITNICSFLTSHGPMV